MRPAFFVRCSTCDLVPPSCYIMGGWLRTRYEDVQRKLLYARRLIIVDRINCNLNKKRSFVSIVLDLYLTQLTKVSIRFCYRRATFSFVNHAS